MSLCIRSHQIKLHAIYESFEYEKITLPEHEFNILTIQKQYIKHYIISEETENVTQGNT